MTQARLATSRASSGATTGATTIGIIGGGQLGRMLVRKAAQMGFDTLVLDPAPDAPAAQVGARQIVGALDDEQAIEALVRGSDLTTYEIEHIAVAPLARLAEEGATIHPAPELLSLIQDKLAQKQFFHDSGLPTSRFVPMQEPELETVRAFGPRAVQKNRFGGYDGRGVAVLPEHPEPSDLLPGPSLLEEFVECAMEVAVVVARRPAGEICSFPVVEMSFDTANVLDVLVAPARIGIELSRRARQLAEDTVSAMQGVGVFGVEMFVTRSGDLLLNEVAPRVHNSGHFTIEACRTCQFEQHLRAIMDLPLGDTSQHSAAVMGNVLGEADSAGPTRMHGLAQSLELPGLAVHMYGKRESRPGRKMGHLTITAARLEDALARAHRAKSLFRVGGDE
jgi:5-(carboxyamino)imidazole ribonucleotide synthase